VWVHPLRPTRRAGPSRPRLRHAYAPPSETRDGRRVVAVGAPATGGVHPVARRGAWLSRPPAQPPARRWAAGAAQRTCRSPPRPRRRCRGEAPLPTAGRPLHRAASGSSGVDGAAANLRVRVRPIRGVLMTSRFAQRCACGRFGAPVYQVSPLSQSSRPVQDDV